MEMPRSSPTGFPGRESGLWRHWYPRLHRFVRHFGGIPASDREDLVQDILLRALEGRRTFRPGARFAPWLYVVARRRCIDRIRRPGDLPADPTILETLPDDGDPEEACLKARDREEIRLFLAGLDRDDRLLVWLRYSEDLGYGAIARILDTPSGTLKWRMHRLKRRLEERWERYEQG